ncbi:MAG: 6-phosphofructokinase [Thermotogota bacterium]
MKKNVVYAQSGGVTSVINASAYGVIRSSFLASNIENVYISINGINGIINEHLMNMKDLPEKEIELLKYTPSSAFGSCRRKIESNNDPILTNIFEIFKKYNIGYFFYNGGNDSMDTANKIAEFAKSTGYDLKVMGIPKTVDNDLPHTDHTPGFGSAAKYLSTSILEGSIDVKSMAKDSTKVFVLETMGRHAGWLAASTAMANINNNFGPHVILLPEISFKKDKFLSKINDAINDDGYCSIAVSEGIKYPDGKFISDLGYKDNFGNKQLGYAGKVISDLIHNELKLKVHTAIPDYLQRSGRHLSSLTDVNEAIIAGEKAVEFATNGISGYMVSFERVSNSPYQIEYKLAPLSKIANETKYLPKDFITTDGLYVTDKFLEYCKPLINGEYYPPFKNGVPDYLKLKIYQ